MAKKAFLICFVGMDGTGKTTQAKRLVDALEARGVKCKYVWNTYQPFITKPFLLLGKALFFRGKDAFKDYAQYSHTKIKVFRTPILSWVYEYLSLFDYLCQSLIKVRLPRLFGSNIICDRYVPDVAVNLAMELNYSDEKLRSRLDGLLSWLPQPDLTFLMDVPEETGYQRKDDTPSIEHLRSLRGIYLSIGKGCGAVMLDGTEDLARLESKILSKVSQAIGQCAALTNGTSENPAIELLRVIGSPLAREKERFSADAYESVELYDLAVRNKVSLLYLEALKQQGKLDRLKAKYDEEQANYLRVLEATARAAAILDAADIEYTVFKTIKPYPAVPSDVDIMVLGNHHREAIRVLLKAGYIPLLSNVVDTAALKSEEDYENAIEILTKPTYDRAHISPTGLTFIDSKCHVHIDLQQELAVSHVVYMDKNKFTQHLNSARLLGGMKVKTLAPELDLATVMAHSLVEQRYTLGEFYSFLYYLSGMDEEQVSNFINTVKQNRLRSAVRTLATITAQLHKEAYGTIPEKLGSILDELGSDAAEAKHLRQNNFEIPHQYKVLTVVKFLLEKSGEPRFSKSVLTQLIKMLNPNLAKLVIRELIGMRRRETYLKEAG